MIKFYGDLASEDWPTRATRRVGAKKAPWSGALFARQVTGRGEHHAALPYGELAAFMGALRQQEGVAARALDFAILTAARMGEVIGARCDEIDMANRLWAIPGTRMKAGKEHRVPLSDVAVAILETMKELRRVDCVFPGGAAGRPLSNMAMNMMLRRMKRDDRTVHGFRSTFRDWAAERTTFPAEVAEMALTHVVSGTVEAAYRRGDLFEKRRQFAKAWATFCAQRHQAAITRDRSALWVKFPP